MPSMINRLVPAVVILLSVLTLTGCSGIVGETPREQADEAISDANESISQHNESFEAARSTYADVKQKIEAGDDPSEEKNNISEAKDDLEDARGHLQEARASLETVENLDVDPAVKEYAGLLSDAMQDQLDAEAKEIEFYSILEEDPALENNRDEALELLSEVGDGYQEAEQTYGEAQDLADAHPKLIEAAPN